MILPDLGGVQLRLNFLLYPHSKYNVVHYLLQFFLITQGLTVIFLMIILTGWKDMWRNGKSWIYHLTEYAPDFLVHPDRFLLLRIL